MQEGVDRTMMKKVYTSCVATSLTFLPSHTTNYRVKNLNKYVVK